MARLEPIHIHAVIATAIYTGARRGKIAGLKWEDVDFEKRTMYIRRSAVKLVGQEPEIKLPKTISSIRQMAIPHALCDVLQELKKEQERKKALLGEKWHEEGFLFTDWCGHVMHPHTKGTLFGTASKRRAPYYFAIFYHIRLILSRKSHRQKPTQNSPFKLSLFEDLNLELLYVYDTFGSALSAKQRKMLQFRIIHQLNSRVFPAYRTLYPLILIHIPYSPLMKKYGSYV